MTAATTFINKLIPKMAEAGPAPCDACPKRRLCAYHRLACWDYVRFYGLSKPKDAVPPEDTSAPTRAYFDRIFTKPQKTELIEYVTGKARDLSPVDMERHYGAERVEIAHEWKERKPKGAGQWRLEEKPKTRGKGKRKAKKR